MKKYNESTEGARFFTDREAWNIFRLAAFGEAFGWTLLIGGLVFKHYVTPKSNIPVEIVGQIHGTLFLLYIAAVFTTHPSLKWSFKQTLVAGLVSVPPYGTLVFEQWVAHERRSENIQTYRQLFVRGIIMQNEKLLVIQPKDSGNWFLPGGEVLFNETPQQALLRILREQTNIKPVIGKVGYIWQHKEGRVQQLELFFITSNSHAYKRVALQKTKDSTKNLDELRFVKPSQADGLVPHYFQSAEFSKPMARSRSSVKFID